MQYQDQTHDKPLLCLSCILSSALHPEPSSFTHIFLLFYSFSLFYCEGFKEKNLVYFFHAEKICLLLNDMWLICISICSSISNIPLDWNGPNTYA